MIRFPALRDRLRDQGTDRQENVVAPAVLSRGAPDKPDYHGLIGGLQMGVREGTGVVASGRLTDYMVSATRPTLAMSAVGTKPHMASACGVSRFREE